MKNQRSIYIDVLENGYGVSPHGFGAIFPRQVFNNLDDLRAGLADILAKPKPGIQENDQKELDGHAKKKERIEK